MFRNKPMVGAAGTLGNSTGPIENYTKRRHRTRWLLMDEKRSRRVCEGSGAARWSFERTSRKGPGMDGLASAGPFLQFRDVCRQERKDGERGFW